MDHEASLRAALSDDGDLELRFQCGQSLPVHSQKLKLASSVLKDLISAVMEDVIASSAAKRRRTAAADGSSSIVDQELPSLQVSHSSLHAGTHSLLNMPRRPGLICMTTTNPRLYANAHVCMRQCDKSRSTAPMRIGWRC